jgi:hypothetical protein
MIPGCAWFGLTMLTSIIAGCLFGFAGFFGAIVFWLIVLIFNFVWYWRTKWY